MDINKLIPTTRVLTANKSQEVGIPEITRQSQYSYREDPIEFEGQGKTFKIFSDLCYRCKNLHTLCDCKDLRRSKPLYFRCGKTGPMSVFIELRKYLCFYEKWLSFLGGDFSFWAKIKFRSQWKWKCFKMRDEFTMNIKCYIEPWLCVQHYDSWHSVYSMLC